MLHVLNWAVWVKDLKKRYGDVKAVDGISFGVSPCEVFGMLGPNGAGKTTTMEIILGLRTADSGDVRVLGMTHAENHRKIASAIGAQLQTTGMYPTHTVREMIQLFSDFYSEAAPVDELIEPPRILVTSVVSKRRNMLDKNCQNSLRLPVPVHYVL